MGSKIKKAPPAKKLKKAIKELKAQRSKITSREKKLSKKLKLQDGDKLKKEKKRALQKLAEKLKSKQKKIKEQLKRKKTALLEINEQVERKKKKTSKPAQLKEPEQAAGHVSKKSGSEAISKANTSPDQEESSTQMNAKLAIAQLRQIANLDALDQFLDQEKRSSVLNAARSRKNALVKSEV